MVLSRARRGLGVDGTERDEAAAAGGNAAGDLVGDGVERFSGRVAGVVARGAGGSGPSGGGVGGLGWRRGLAPAASSPRKRRAVSSPRQLPRVSGRELAAPAVRSGGEDVLRVGAAPSHGQGGFGSEEGVLLPAVLEKVVAAKGGALAADWYPHGPEAMVRKASHASVRNAGFLEINGAGGFFGFVVDRVGSDQLGKKHSETLDVQGQELEEGEIADTVEITQGMIKNDALTERQELEEGEIAVTTDNVEDMNKNVLNGPVEEHKLEEGATMDIVGVMAKEDLDGPVEGHELEEAMDILVATNKDALNGSVEGQEELEEGEIAPPMDIVEKEDGIMRSKEKDHAVQQSQFSIGGIMGRKIKFTAGKTVQPPVKANDMSQLVTLDRSFSSTSATPIDLASTSALASKEKLKFEPVFVTKEKLKGKRAVYLEDDDILMAVAVHGGRLELCLGARSRVRSVWRHGPHGGQNADPRIRVRMMCRRFQFLCRFLAQAVKQGSMELSRVDLAADHVIKKLPDYIKYGSIVGEVDGVEVGDEFLYRVELAIVGLHNPFRAGIDTTKDNDGELIAVSIVASGGYLDEYSSSGELIYIGSGGKASGTDQNGDQKLERGNLALKNCMERNIPVRVIHGFKTQNREEGSHSIGKEIPKFIYDGLYHVVGFWQEGIPGSRVFKYRLRRIRGQPKLPLHVAKWLRKSVVRQMYL